VQTNKIQIGYGIYHIFR